MTSHGDPLRLWLHGASGRMGQQIQQAVNSDRNRFCFVGGSSRTFEGEAFYQGRTVTPSLLADRLVKDKPDVIIDFSTVEGHDVLRESVRSGHIRRAKFLIGTTGIHSEAINEWRSYARQYELAILLAPNTSVGILLTLHAALKVATPLANLGFDIEVIETHHKMKRDAPSGTAHFLASALSDKIVGSELVFHRAGARQSAEIGVHSVRGGGVIGEHEIRMIGDLEEVTISHRAFSRSLFASGALILARWLSHQKTGFYELLDVTLEDFLAFK